MSVTWPTVERQVSFWAILWEVPRLPELVTFRQNPRLRTTIARWVPGFRCIELGTRFFTLEGQQEEVLCHELAHAAVSLKHGPGVMAHGPEWRALIKAAGFVPCTRLEVSSRGLQPARAARASRLYEHRCPVCQGVRYAKRAMMRWRCVECMGTGLPGELKISVLARGRD
jgi:predicted SprT family Zn-dependent metalloprotease